VSLLYALEKQVELIEQEGFENRLARHRGLAERTWEWCGEMGLRILAEPAFRSPTITTIYCPDGWDGPGLAAAVKQHGYQIATGYGRMKDETFRIGHMGDHTVDGLDGLLAVLSRVLKRA
jgi:aspartate aminotransferase-like enzyme